MFKKMLKKLYIRIMLFLTVLYAVVCVINIHMYRRNQSVELSERMRELSDNTNKIVALVPSEKAISDDMVIRLDVNDINKKEKEYIVTQITTSILQLIVIGVILYVLLNMFAKPMEESNLKQKRFITNASHDLKTPLTLLKTNVDILEMEYGTNEWIDDMRTEMSNMTSLINNMVELSKMSEMSDSSNKKRDVSMELSECLLDVVSEYEEAFDAKGFTLNKEITDGIVSKNDEANIRKLLTILFDNAVKYCDADGTICVSLNAGKHIELAVTNSYQAVDTVKFDKLFDRFYREDEARTAGEGFGMGLAIAKNISEIENAKIIAYKAADAMIGFKVVIKK